MELRPRKEEIAEAHEVVSSVVVLCQGQVCIRDLDVLQDKGPRGSTLDLQFGKNAIEGRACPAGNRQ